MNKLYIEMDKRLTNSSLVRLQEWVIGAQPKGFKNYNSEKTLNTFDNYLYPSLGLLYLTIKPTITIISLTYYTPYTLTQDHHTPPIMGQTTERERERERKVPWRLDGVGLDGLEGDGVGSMDGDGGVDGVVVMSIGMLCERDGRKKNQKTGERKKKQWCCATESCEKKLKIKNYKKKKLKKKKEKKKRRRRRRRGGGK
jgi:hypothetical protein